MTFSEMIGVLLKNNPENNPMCPAELAGWWFGDWEGAKVKKARFVAGGFAGRMKERGLLSLVLTDPDSPVMYRVTEKGKKAATGCFTHK